MSRLDWDRASKRDLVRDHGYDPVREPQARKPRGISNAQAKELAALQRQLRIPYTGSGMTSQEASALINRLKQEVQERA